ncbi:DUF1869 domain-containing protein [Salmonella enterica subsp. enterica serovar Muenchen]|uniref:DUF1869 domain-containing protein n=1 Tax=Salmonella enterica TaxID=28901 RepID=UPI00126D5B6C|nr:DUF1869 domain-containing protein [Salmonella enterica]EDH5856558.1 hypothetical protein [Salmonella enterica subsp. enterica serovar Oranienburg]EHM0996573.1 DUF1869 domain-containing protein [Salmonella enterica subsp. enterica serovar Newport]EIC0165895.1 DUF1869 domain-containing protein [Salmonella enterica subsp. enterica serovar Kinondoni]EIM5532568.1 DUF1869 domain-containing protein [Salmonella enterica subsp. enterica]ELD8112039.1 DUF1869 domain-containing protein [Salmonella ente
MKHDKKGYELKIISCSGTETVVINSFELQGLYANDTVKHVLHKLTSNMNHKHDVMLSITNNSNGISVVRDYPSSVRLNDINHLVKEIKEIANIILGYEVGEEKIHHD